VHEQLGGPDTASATAYLVPMAWRLRGPVHADALRAALGDVVARHEALRTLFPLDEDGRPYQQVLAGPVEPDVACVDVVRADVAPGEVAARLAAETGRGFALDRELPVRAALLRVARADRGEDRQDEHVLLLTLHHIAVDEWSVPVLLADLADAYAARVVGSAPEPVAPAVQYVDVTLWQRELLGAEDDPGSRAHAQLEFWRETLAGLPAEITLPTDRPRRCAASPASAGPACSC